MLWDNCISKCYSLSQPITKCIFLSILLLNIYCQKRKEKINGTCSFQYLRHITRLLILFAYFSFESGLLVVEIQVQIYLWFSYKFNIPLSSYNALKIVYWYVYHSICFVFVIQSTRKSKNEVQLSFFYACSFINSILFIYRCHFLLRMHLHERGTEKRMTQDDADVSRTERQAAEYMFQPNPALNSLISAGTLVCTVWSLKWEEKRVAVIFV